jgi:SAM-dependent methyltransferase
LRLATSEPSGQREDRRRSDKYRPQPAAADVRRSLAEHLPFPNASFDAALAQLVVHFMKDPVVALAEMGRVTRWDGIVAACIWDHGGGEGCSSRCNGFMGSMAGS